MYPPLNQDVTLQKYGGLEGRRVKLVERKRWKYGRVLKSEWAQVDTCRAEYTHPLPTHCARKSCFLPHTCFYLALWSGRLTLKSHRASSLALWLLARSCEARCWLKTGGGRENGDRDLPFIFQQHLSPRFHCSFVPKAAAWGRQPLQQPQPLWPMWELSVPWNVSSLQLHLWKESF